MPQSICTSPAVLSRGMANPTPLLLPVWCSTRIFYPYYSFYPNVRAKLAKNGGQNSKYSRSFFKMCNKSDFSTKIFFWPSFFATFARTFVNIEFVDKLKNPSIHITGRTATLCMLDQVILPILWVEWIVDSQIWVVKSGLGWPWMIVTCQPDGELEQLTLAHQTATDIIYILSYFLPMLTFMALPLLLELC